MTHQTAMMSRFLLDLEAKKLFCFTSEQYPSYHLPLTAYNNIQPFKGSNTIPKSSVIFSSATQIKLPHSLLPALKVSPTKKLSKSQGG